MKKTIKTCALFVVLMALAPSCQKEVVQTQPQMDVVYNIYTANYTINGVPYSAVIVGDEAWLLFVQRMVTLASEGCDVSFQYEESRRSEFGAKDVVTYTTSSYDDAVAWADKMARDGYIVEVRFDEKTKIYTCVAIN